jgi:hypothetical protein
MTNEPFKSFKNSRVGFNEVVQIIPRPLSLVSSDSSSTVRGPSHSVSGSISSIISAGSPPSKEPRARQDARPKTADNQPSRAPDALKRRGSLPLLMESATASLVAPSTPRSARKWTFLWRNKVRRVVTEIQTCFRLKLDERKRKLRQLNHHQASPHPMCRFHPLNHALEDLRYLESQAKSKRRFAHGLGRFYLVNLGNGARRN